MLNAFLNVDRLTLFLKKNARYLNDNKVEVEWKIMKGAENGIDRGSWMRLQDNLESILKSIPGYRYTEETRDIVHIYENGERKIERDGGKVSKDVKKRLDNYLIKLSNDFLLKLSLSSEMSANNAAVQNSPLKMTRERVRQSFRFEEYSIEFTHVLVFQDGRQTGDVYEIEIEFTTNANIQLSETMHPQQLSNELRKVIDRYVYPLKVIFNLPTTISIMEISPPSGGLKKITYEGIVQQRENINQFMTRKGNGKPLLNNPINLKRGQFKEIASDYAVTNKLDGVRYLLYISDNVIFFANDVHIQPLKIYPSGHLKKISNSVLEGELYNEEETNRKHFYPYDIRVLREKNQDYLNLQQRIVNCKELLGELQLIYNLSSSPDTQLAPPIGRASPTRKPDGLSSRTPFVSGGGTSFFTMKEYYTSDNIVDNIFDTLNLIKDGNNRNMNNDGFIFTSKGDYNKRVYKWKYPELLSIDFAIYKDIDASSDNVHVYNLYVGEGNGAVRFKTSKGDSTITIGKDSRWFGKLTNGMVVECFYKGEYEGWEVTRIRYDKVKPNYISIAQDVYEDILNPITFEELIEGVQKIQERDQGILAEEVVPIEPSTRIEPAARIHQVTDIHPLQGQERELNNNGEGLTNMRENNNLYKNDLISKYAKGVSVLDIGFGKGGDVFKYYYAGTTQLWAVEPNGSHISEAKVRIDKLLKFRSNLVGKTSQQFINNLHIIQCGGDESTKIYNVVKQPVRTISSFFSLTFFFETESKLDKLMQTLDLLSEDNTYFIGTTMDGNQFLNFINDHERLGTYSGDPPGSEFTLHTPNYTIVKNMQTNGNVYGNDLSIDLDGTIVQRQREYLVFYDTLKAKLDKIGFKEVSTAFFTPNHFVGNKENNPKGRALREFGKDEKELTPLFRSFVFQKRNSPFLFKEKYNLRKFKTKFSDNLYYLDTIGDGSCFFHSIINLLHDDYMNKTKDEKKATVKGFREDISNKLTFEEWKKLGNGQLALITYYNSLINILFKYLDLEKRGVTKKELIQQLPTGRDYTITDIDNNLSKYIDRDTLECFQLSLFHKYKRMLADCSVYVGIDFNKVVDALELASIYFDVNIYLFDESTKEPYVTSYSYIPSKRSIVLLWSNHNHYEPLLRMNSANDLTRVFNPGDPFVESINLFLHQKRG